MTDRDGKNNLWYSTNGNRVPNVESSWAWYRKNFGVNVKIFEEARGAFNDQIYWREGYSRTATLALSMDGGGVLRSGNSLQEIRKKANFSIKLGDCMIACKIKSRDVKATHQHMKNNGVDSISK